MATAAPATKRSPCTATRPTARPTRRWASTTAGVPAPTSPARRREASPRPYDGEREEDEEAEMRKIVVGAFVSLDGVMQAPAGPEEDPSGGFRFGGWVFPYWDEPMGQYMDELSEAEFDLLLGRRTYEIFAAYWPFIEDDPIADRLNAVTKFVETSSGEPPAWPS